MNDKSALPAARLREIARLYAAKKFDEVVRLTIPQAGDPPDIDYYRGMALAKLKRWSEARQALELGRRKAPKDKRFPTELAGIAFLQKQYGAAAKDLRRVLKLDPSDAYALNFAATVYSLEGNLPAALQCWNRIGMPQIREIAVRPEPRIDPVLLRSAIDFSPAAVLTRPDLRTSQVLLGSLGIFSRTSLALTPASRGGFTAQFAAEEKNGLQDANLTGLFSALRGLPYATVYPEWFNLRHAAINLTSLLRWDPNKERVFASFDGPFGENPKWRYNLTLDARRENWNLTSTLFGAAHPVSNLQLEKIEAGGEVENIVSGRLQWAAGVDFSGRTFRNVRSSNPSAARFFQNGFAAEYRSSFKATLLDLPERRLLVSASASLNAGRLFSRGGSSFVQATAGTLAQWFPLGEGDDYEMRARIRAGATAGAVPFDDLFILGLERDNDLWLRAHIGTADGKKGSAPLGRDYTLINWNDSKNIYHNGFLSLKLGPFFDSGKITDPSHVFGSQKWLFDTGIEITVRVLGSATAELFFGKDLRSGRTTFYGTTSH
ncbi:MAG: hypothetical protein ACRD3D_15200 [Terriglobia bacterium]